MFFRYSILILFLLVVSCEKSTSTKPEHVRSEEQKALIDKAKAFDKVDLIDSAYVYFYKVLEDDIANHDSIGIIKSNVNLMALEYKMNDFPACEKRCEFIIDYSKKHQRYSSLCDAYNFLGLSALAQKKYDEALNNFNLLKETYSANGNEVDTILYFLNFHNNTANVYAAMKDYKKSNELYQVILDVDGVKNEPEDYARALDNKAKNTMDNGNLDMAYPLFLEALQYRQKEAVPSSLITSYMHLAEYNLLKNNFSEAAAWANKSWQNCIQIHSVQDEMNTLQILSKANPENARMYFDRYAILKDSMLLVERNFKDNTARIRMETKKKEEQILYEKSENTKKDKYLFLGSLALFTAIVGVSILMRQKRKINEQKQVLNRQNSQLENKNTQILSLQSEVHHRVKNDLENVMRSIHKMQQQNEETKSLHKKIFSIKLVHDMLVDHPDQIEVDLNEFIQKLMSYQYETYQNEQQEVELQFDVVGKLNYKRARSLGLLLNELTTNSYKHAFNNLSKGIISIKTQIDDNQIILTYSDNGKGVNPLIDFSTTTKRGMRLIARFSEKLDGKIKHISSEQGVCFVIKFPIEIME